MLPENGMNNVLEYIIENLFSYPILKTIAIHLRNTDVLHVILAFKTLIPLLAILCIFQNNTHHMIRKIGKVFLLVLKPKGLFTYSFWHSFELCTAEKW